MQITSYDTLYKRKRHIGELSSQTKVPSEYMSIKTFSYNPNNERPLKSNPQDSSFKGLSFMGSSQQKDEKMKPLLATLSLLAATGFALRLAPGYKKAGSYSIKEFSEFIEKKAGMDKAIVDSLLNHVKDSKFTKKMVKISGDTISFNKKTIPQLIWDGLTYPFKILPADILNGSVVLLGKIKPLKGWSKNVLKTDTFAAIRQRSKADAQVNSLRGLFEMSQNLKGKANTDIASSMFRQSVKISSLLSSMRSGLFCLRSDIKFLPKKF